MATSLEIKYQKVKQLFHTYNQYHQEEVVIIVTFLFCTNKKNQLISVNLNAIIRKFQSYRFMSDHYTKNKIVFFNTEPIWINEHFLH